MTRWVCKFDGSIQCSDVQGQSLAEMRQQLEAVVGSANVLNERQFAAVMIQLCGMPTGMTNAYELTDAGYRRLFHGFVGPMGFRDCNPDAKPRLAADSFANANLGDLVEQSRVTGATANPALVRELIGHPIRVYEQGSGITKDFRPDRVNIVTLNGEIVDIWFG